MLMTGAQLRAARAMLRMEQGEVAEAAGISVGTVRRLEGISGRLTDVRVATLDALAAAFGRYGVVFTDGGRPGVAIELARLDSAA